MTFEFKSSHLMGTLNIDPGSTCYREQVDEPTIHLRIGKRKAIDSVRVKNSVQTVLTGEEPPSRTR